MDLVNLQPTTESHAPRLVIYGPQGTGKSTFGASAPRPIFMDVEGGLDGLTVAKQRVQTWADVLGMLKATLEQPHSFQTLTIDSADWIERIIHDAVCRTNKVSTITDIGYNKGFDQATDYWQVFTERLTEIREKRGMIIIVLAHEKVTRFDDPLGPGYDKYSLNLHKQSSPFLLEWADGILFMKNKTVTTSEKGGFTGEIRKAQGMGVYMHAHESPAYIAKNRKLLSLPAEFPISKNDPWGDFVKQLGKGA